MENEIMYIKLDDIIPNRFQPREVFDEEALNRLAESIKEHGVIEPILVRPVSNKFEIVAGERRYKASVLAGLTKIPAMVRQLDDKESSIIAFIENEHRSNVSAIEEARTMDRIIQNNNMTQEELAKELGVNQSTIANKLRLLNLPMEVQEAVMHNEISERHARSLLSVKEEDKQIELLNKIKENKMTVRELDSEIKNMNGNVEDQNNFNYMNMGTNEPNIPSAAPEPAFMSYLNNNPASQPQPAPAPSSEGSFMDYLNSYNNNPVPPVENPTPVTNTIPTPTNDYMGFNPGPQPAPTPSSEGNFMDYLNNTPTNPEPAPNNDSFMNFLNNYDNSNPLPPEETSVELPGNDIPPVNLTNEEFSMPETPSDNPTQEPAFMDFLNNYDNNNPLPPEEEPTEVPSNDDFAKYLNDYDNNNPLPPEPVVENEEIPTTMVQDTTPPTVDYTNQYVEDTANFVDVSKQEKITNVDTVINKLGTVIREIKDKSVFKVDTEEINFDDKYQITITIDKRDF